MAKCEGIRFNKNIKYSDIVKLCELYVDSYCESLPLDEAMANVEKSHVKITKCLSANFPNDNITSFLFWKLMQNSISVVRAADTVVAVRYDMAKVLDGIKDCDGTINYDTMGLVTQEQENGNN